MARRPIEVYAFLPCAQVSWEGPAGPTTSRTLEGVGYVYFTSERDGFPYQTELSFLLRLAYQRRKRLATMLYVTALWHDGPTGRPREAWTRRFGDFSVAAGPIVRDIVSTVDGVYEGRGVYEFRVWYEAPRKLDGVLKRRVLTRTYIRIESC